MTAKIDGELFWCNALNLYVYYWDGFDFCGRFCGKFCGKFYMEIGALCGNEEFSGLCQQRGLRILRIFDLRVGLLDSTYFFYTTQLSLYVALKVKIKRIKTEC